MAKTYKKKGNKLQIIDEVIEEKTVAELDAKRADIVAGVAQYQAALADVDFLKAKAIELGIDTQ